jgi:hypothetical protein
MLLLTSAACCYDAIDEHVEVESGSVGSYTGVLVRQYVILQA